MQTSSSNSQAFMQLTTQIGRQVQDLQAKRNGRTAISAPKASSSVESVPQYGFQTSLHNYALNRLDPQSSFSLHQFSAMESGREFRQYAGKSYEMAGNLNQTAEPLLDFMHKNNRDFNFKI